MDIRELDDEVFCKYAKDLIKKYTDIDELVVTEISRGNNGVKLVFSEKNKFNQNYQINFENYRIFSCNLPYKNAICYESIDVSWAQFVASNLSSKEQIDSYIVGFYDYHKMQLESDFERAISCAKEVYEVGDMKLNCALALISSAGKQNLLKKEMN